MHWSWTASGITETDVLSLVDAKAQLRVTTSDEDDLITALIGAAREFCENYCNRAIAEQTVVFKADWFPSGLDILLPQSPVVSVTSIQYVDGNGTTQVWDSSEYTVDISSLPCRISPAYNYSYPSTRPINNAVTITYEAGEATPPASIVTAMKMMMAGLWEVRASQCPIQLYEPPFGVKALLNPYKLYYRGPFQRKV